MKEIESGIFEKGDKYIIFVDHKKIGVSDFIEEARYYRQQYLMAIEYARIKREDEENDND